MKLICPHCDREYEYDRSKGHRKTTCANCMVTKHRRKKKLWAIEYKGGKCQRCGYNKNEAALVFHHLNGTDKDFGLSQSTGFCRSYEKLKAELDKCDLLCSNCHIEIHNPGW